MMKLIRLCQIKRFFLITLLIPCFALGQAGRQKEMALFTYSIITHTKFNELGGSDIFFKTTVEQLRDSIKAGVVQENPNAQGKNYLDERSMVVEDQQDILIYIILFLVILIVLSFLIFITYREKEKTVKQLAEQREKVRKLVKELKETQSQLVHSEKRSSLVLLTNDIIHEINNAINFVYSGVRILKDKTSEIESFLSKKTEEKTLIEEQSKKIKCKEVLSIINEMTMIIQTGTERITEILKGLRLFSELDTEKKTVIDIHKEIDVALSLLSNKYRGAIDIEKKFNTKKMKINGFKGQLSQVFLNIISHSIDVVGESDKKRKIKIETKKNNDEIAIKIACNEIGLSEEEVMKFLDPFYTVKNVETGVGLSISYGIIERHKGTITTDSKLGKGAEIVIKLPSEKLKI